MHICHDQVSPFTSLESWKEADRIRSSRFLGPVYGTACILSTYGNLEVVVARTDGALAHFWRQEIFGWHGPIFLPGDAAGPPAFIQSRYGAFGNFEVVVPRPCGGLSHFWRDNDETADWHVATYRPATLGQWEGLGLIHNSDGILEIVGVVDGNLTYIYQHGVGRSWEPPQVIAKGFKGRPCLIQNAVSPKSNYLSVAAMAEGGLACFLRNDNTGLDWRNAGRFGNDRRGQFFKFDDVTVMQSSFGRTEVVSRCISGPGLALRHYRRACRRWEGPNELPFFDCDP
jgi:hypothetical protein